MSEAPRRRSRFDRAEPEPAESKARDRSRSPSNSRPDSRRRSRSPVNPSAAAAAAAVTAARIKASLGSRPAPSSPSVSTPRPTSSQSQGHKSEDGILEQDGDFIKDIEINDLRNRYTLTKGDTQKMIKEETGADVTSRGSYYPDKSLVKPGEPPLFLHITHQTRDGLAKAVAKIEELMQQELPNLIDERRFRPRGPPRDDVERDEFGRVKDIERRINVDLEPIPNFNLRAQIIGKEGANVKHIQGTTRCRVQIKGRGSGFADAGTDQESDEPLHLHISGKFQDRVDEAVQLAEGLLSSVRNNYHAAKSRRDRPDSYRGDHGHRDRGYHDRGQDRGRGGNGGYDHRGSGPDEGQSQDPQAAYYAQYGYGYGQAPQGQDQGQAQGQGEDPYAPYGGYEAYCKYYYEYMQSQQQGGGQYAAPGQEGTPNSYAAQTQGYGPPGAQGYGQGYGQAQAPYGQDGASGSPQPPPPGSQSQHQPPPGSSGGSYNAVPPPPGL